MMKNIGDRDLHHDIFNVRLLLFIYAYVIYAMRSVQTPNLIMIANNYLSGGVPGTIQVDD